MYETHQSGYWRVDSRSFKTRWLSKPGRLDHVLHTRNVYTWATSDGQSCTTTVIFKMTNGKLQLQDSETVCND